MPQPETEMSADEPGKPQPDMDAGRKATTPSAGEVPQPGTKRAVPNLRSKKTTKSWYEHLTGYLGWWRRMEGEALRDSKKGDTGEYRRGGESQEDAKMKFLSKFYPSACRTPGGSQQLVGGSSATIRNMRADMEKVLTPSPKRKSTDNLEFISPAKKIRKNFQQKLVFWKTKTIMDSINILANNYTSDPISDLTTRRTENNGIGGILEGSE